LAAGLYKKNKKRKKFKMIRGRGKGLNSVQEEKINIQRLRAIKAGSLGEGTLGNEKKEGGTNWVRGPEKY